MKRSITNAVVMAAFFAIAAVAHGADNKSAVFLKDAIQGNLAEVKLGELANANSTSSEIHSFAAMLKTDHSAANDEAKEAAKTLNVTPPTEPNEKQKATYQKLSKLQGEKFDVEFSKAMVDDHKKDVAKYEAATKMNDASGAYAQKILPKLRMHLQKAEDLTSRYK